MSAIILSTDGDVKLLTSAQEISDRVGHKLAETYPGYRWRITPHPHPTRPFVDIQCESGGHAMFGGTIKLWEFYSASSLDKEIMRIGGSLLECFHLNRRAFDETEFVSREKNFAGIILPDYVPD